MKKFRLGYTTGVFDLFHIGHLNILKRAKEQCEYLVVGVSTDKLVQDYKSKTPVIPFEERVLIVEAIKFVDEVVPQFSMDKLEAWKRIKFDAYFIGDDWKGSERYIQLERKFNNLGVKIVFFPYTRNTSSTKLSRYLDLYLSKSK